MEIWKEPGESGKVYHVFRLKKGQVTTNADIAEMIAEAARYQKIARAKMLHSIVWIKGDSLYTEKVSGGKEAIAITRRPGT